MESAGRDPAYVKAMLGRRGTTTPAVNPVPVGSDSIHKAAH
jgi:hypothetical protein